MESDSETIVMCEEDRCGQDSINICPCCNEGACSKHYAEFMIPARSIKDCVYLHHELCLSCLAFKNECCDECGLSSCICSDSDVYFDEQHRC